MTTEYESRMEYKDGSTVVATYDVPTETLTFVFTGAVARAGATPEAQKFVTMALDSTKRLVLDGETA